MWAAPAEVGQVTRVEQPTKVGRPWVIQHPLEMTQVMPWAVAAQWVTQVMRQALVVVMPHQVAHWAYNSAFRNPPL